MSLPSLVVSRRRAAQTERDPPARATPEAQSTHPSSSLDSHQRGLTAAEGLREILGGAEVSSFATLGRASADHSEMAVVSAARTASADLAGVERFAEVERFVGAFGVSAGHVSPRARAELGRALRALQMSASFADGRVQSAFPGAGEIRFDGSEGPDGERVRLSILTAESTLEVEITSSPSGLLTARMKFESSSGDQIEGRTERSLVAVPVTGGAVLIAQSLGVEGRGASVPSDDELDDFGDLIAEESEEGVVAFLNGALLGDFGDDNSWSAVAGQTLVGFVPIAGQVADIRDLVAAGRLVAAGEPGAPLMLGAAALGIIPGLDFLKGATRVSRRAIREAAEGLGEVAQSGMKHAGKRLGKEAAKRAKKELAALAAGRVELIAKLDQALLDPRWSQQTRSGLKRARNALAKALKPSDLAGALRDVLGVPVKKGVNGEVYDHLGEISDALASLERARQALVSEIGGLVGAGDQPGALARLADALLEVRKRCEGFLEIRK